MTESILCFIFRDNPHTEVLLGFKKAGFGAGKYTGFGGKVELGETIISATIREMREESSVNVQEENLFYAAQLTFVFPWRPSWSQMVHVYVAHKWSGTPSESFEMKPAWFAFNEVPYDRMWQDAVYWLPPILKSERIQASFTFKADNERIAELSIATWEGNDMEKDTSQSLNTKETHSI